MNFKSIKDLNIDISKNLSVLKSENFDLIVGIPRSGMLPASIIALKLNLPLMTISEYLADSQVKHGRTRKPSSNVSNAHNAKKVLIVDDSINSGDSIEEVKKQIPQEKMGVVKFLAVYGVQKNNDIDFILDIVPSPRIFEWNAMYHGIIENACFDIDGVLCEDPLESQNDDGEKYSEFLESAKPLYLPLFKIDTLVTNRLEKYRPQTEAWLAKNNIQYNRLEMLNISSKKERLEQQDYYKHKSDIYKKSNTKIFYESSLQQAKVIFERTQKPVYCVDEHILITPSTLKTLLTPSSAKWIIKERLYGFKLVRRLHKIAKRLKIY